MEFFLFFDNWYFLFRQWIWPFVITHSRVTLKQFFSKNLIRFFWIHSLLLKDFWKLLGSLSNSLYKLGYWSLNIDCFKINMGSASQIYTSTYYDLREKYHRIITVQGRNEIWIDMTSSYSRKNYNLIDLLNHIQWCILNLVLFTF